MGLSESTRALIRSSDNPTGRTVVNLRVREPPPEALGHLKEAALVHFQCPAPAYGEHETGHTVDPPEAGDEGQEGQEWLGTVLGGRSRRDWCLRALMPSLALSTALSSFGVSIPALRIKS